MPLTSVLAVSTEQQVEVERSERTERRLGAEGGGCGAPVGPGGGMKGINGGGPDMGGGYMPVDGSGLIPEGIDGRGCMPVGIEGSVGIGTEKPRGSGRGKGRGGTGKRGSTSTSIEFAHGPPRLGASLCESLSLTMNLSIPVGYETPRKGAAAVFVHSSAEFTVLAMRTNWLGVGC